MLIIRACFSPEHRATLASCKRDWTPQPAKGEGPAGQKNCKKNVISGSQKWVRFWDPFWGPSLAPTIHFLFKAKFEDPFLGPKTGPKLGPKIDQKLKNRRTCAKNLGPGEPWRRPPKATLRSCKLGSRPTHLAFWLRLHLAILLPTQRLTLEDSVFGGTFLAPKASLLGCVYNEGKGACYVTHALT